MRGMLIWKMPERGGGVIRLRERSVLHTRFLCAEVARGPRTPAAVVRRRVAAAARRLGKAGVREVVLPEGFAYGEQLKKGGVEPVFTGLIRRAIAADWVRWSLAERGRPAAGGRVAVSAAALTPEVARTVTELALRHRYVLVDLPYGGEALAAQLRKEYGVSLLLSPTQEQLAEVDAAAVFDPGRLEPGPGRLSLYDETAALPPLSLPPALEEKLPAGASRGQLFSVLREAGALRPGQLSVGL